MTQCAASAGAFARAAHSLPVATGPARGLASRNVLVGASLSADARWLRSARYGSSLEPHKPCSGKRTRWVGPFAALIQSLRESTATPAMRQVCCYGNAPSVLP